MSGIPKPTLSYDESQWKIEIFPMSTSDFLVFTYVGESSRGDGKTYPHKLKPISAPGRYARINIVIQVAEYEFIIVCCVDVHEDLYSPTKTVGYDVYQIMIYPDIPNENGTKIVRFFKNKHDVSFLRTTKSFMIFMSEHRKKHALSIYSVIDTLTLAGWIQAQELSWNIPGEIRIDKYHDNPALPTLVTGHIMGDFEMEFEIDLRKGRFADGFQATSPCRSKLHKNMVEGLVSFYDVDNFIKANLNDLKTADFYMQCGGFYIGDEKLPVFEKDSYRKKLAIWEKIAKQKLMEANNLKEAEPVKAEGPPQILSGFRVWPGINVRPVDNTLVIEHDGKVSIIESIHGLPFYSFCQIGKKTFIGIAKQTIFDSEVIYNICRYTEDEAGKIVYSVEYDMFPCVAVASNNFFSSNDDDMIYLDNYRYCVSEDRPIEDSQIDRISRLECLFATTDDDRKILIEARRYKKIYFLTTVQKEDSGYVVKILDKVYNAYTGTVFNGIESLDGIVELEHQNHRWEDWAKIEISKIAP